MTPHWPCTACDQPGVRNVGTEGKCARHLADLYHTFDPTVFKLNGVGLPGASADDRHLTCCACGATWHGLAGEHCRWCARAAEIQLEHQAQLALTPPDTDPDDATYKQRMDAWVDRLVAATTAGIVTSQQAQHALRREVERHGKAA